MSRDPVKVMPSYDELHRLFIYDPETGALRARISRPPLKAGSLVGTVRKGRCKYLAVGIAGKYYLAHRIIWKMVTGEEPEDMIDHIDGDKLNNKFGNLRPATNGTNRWNATLQKNNTTGVKGVCLNGKRGKWLAHIGVGGKQMHLGHFNTLEEAKAARQAAAQILHGEYFREA